MNKTNLFIEAGVLLAFLLSTAPHFTGNLIHEWLGVALVAALIAHILLHWDWIICVGFKFFKNLWQVSRFQFFVDIFVFIAFITLITTGLMMSKYVMSTLGIQLAMASRSVKMIHSTASNAAVLLTGVHIALHWNWIVCMVKKSIVLPLQSIFHPHTAIQPVIVKSSDNHQAKEIVILKTLGKLLVKVLVIGLVAFAVVPIINNSSSTSMELPSGDRPGGFQPGQAFTTDKTGATRLPFKGHDRNQAGGGIIGAFEIFKNLGIIALITGVVLLVRWGIAKLSRSHRVASE